ncbi:MAG: A/G-specific adenine glycosylase [Sulfuritalea sp.]|nr:A/G-specific adenine glycosylase [Polynucleobacter sp.]MCF8188186.1 A/G-specific adenine glycosylase [Sulfuritalea sp.]
MRRIITDQLDITIDLSFSATLIEWQQQHGRNQLPWQQTRDAYRIWLSEIMLQQTQVATVIQYYQKFLQRFPTIFSLAESPVEDVMAHWSGLGYYTRARNLHRCAQRVVADYLGQFPADVELLSDLPGIGPSTAAAISAFAYGTRAAILDGNVKRVFCRIFGVEGFPSSSSVEKQLWELALALLPEQSIEAYTQGLMDLGATLCTRSRPRCHECPFASRCMARITQRVNELPMRKPKKAIPEKFTVMLVIEHDQNILLEQRPPTGIWGGLLSLPEVSRLLTPSERPISKEDLHAELAEFGEVEAISVMPEFTHAFSHYKLKVVPLRVKMRRVCMIAAQANYQWLPAAKLKEAALPAPIKKLLVD